MTPESIKMSDLILEAYQKCKDNGHRMDWRRYSNYLADAECIDCKAWVEIYMKLGHHKPYGQALNIKCKGKP